MTPSTDSPHDFGLVAVLELVCTALTMLAAWVVIFRDGGWRKAGEHKRFAERLGRAEAAAENWHQTAEARAIKHKLAEHDRQLGDHANALESVATKEDMARLSGQIALTQGAAEAAAQGVDRIEGILIKRALEA